MKRFFRTRYRIVNDAYAGYQVDYKPWWSPFWIQAGFTNTHSSLERAEDFMNRHKNKVVKYYD
jgi:hypothetical protein